MWMMWLEGDQTKSPKERVLEAVEFYQGKYGVRPNVVLADLDFPETEMEDVVVERSQLVLKDHLHLTVDESAFLEAGGGGNGQ
jgi:hypothetical protein